MIDAQEIEHSKENRLQLHVQLQCTVCTNVHTCIHVHVCTCGYNKYYSANALLAFHTHTRLDVHVILQCGTVPTIPFSKVMTSLCCLSNTEELSTLMILSPRRIPACRNNKRKKEVWRHTCTYTCTYMFTCMWTRVLRVSKKIKIQTLCSCFRIYTHEHRQIIFILFILHIITSVQKMINWYKCTLCTTTTSKNSRNMSTPRQ